MSGTKVILLRSTDTGAPVLSGTAGALVALLDACLQDGYNSKTVTLARTGSMVTATCATAHGFAADGLTKINISGAAQSEYNGDFQITNVTTLTFDFTVTGTPATPATGTITTKAAPLGWSNAFSGTNKGAYRSNEVTGTQLYLRVDDTTDGGQTAGLRGYETMIDVDTGTGPFPTLAQLADPGIMITKSNVASNAARPWVLVGDGFEFILFTAAFSPSYANIYIPFHFGDPASEMASDPYGCLIYSQTTMEYNPGNNNSPNDLSIDKTAQPGHFFARNYTQTGQAIGAAKYGNTSLGGVTIGAFGLFAYPAPSNNGLYISPIYVGDTLVLRSQLKPIWQPLQIRPLGNLTLLAADVSPVSRRLLSIRTSYSGNNTGETHIDIDGPWR